ncbi:MAG: DUF2971 domain-containing protein [Methylobacter tundripaludum]|nr:DUF2971 domain-containing protein [Methylobacter tundripaludum]
MLYYRFRPFSELSIKELIYNEIFFTSTDECNDPFDSKAFYEFSDQVDYWSNLLKIVGDKIGGLDERLINAIAKRISHLCPMTYDDALNLDITQICFDMMLQKNTALFQSLAVCFNQVLKLYKPEPSYFACFSKVNNEPLMWSHYASQHQGFCLIFKPIDGKLRQFPPYQRRSIRRNTPNGLAPNSSYGLPDAFIFQDVTYHQEVIPLCGFHRLPVAVTDKKLSEAERVKLVQEQSEQFLHKHNSWRDEQEARISITPRMSWVFGENIELTSFERLFYYEPTQLVGIIFGAKMSKRNKDRLIEILLEKQERISHSADYERIIFDFAIFEANLSNKRREIQIDIEKILTLSKVYNKNTPEFIRAYDKWKDGWGIKFEGNRSSRVQVLS